MAILVDSGTSSCVSGITGREGTFHSLRNRDYGTYVVAGVTPGKGGQDVEGVPVFDTFHAAVSETGANTAMIFVPPRFAADSILEAEDAGVELIIAITEGIPAHDELRVYNHLAPAHSPDRPELPGDPVAREGERRDHPRAVLQGGQRRARVPIGDADVPDRKRAGPERVRQLVDRRNRRRPGARLELHRHHRAVRSRSGDGADRDVRGDRRVGGGGGGAEYIAASVSKPVSPNRRLHGAAGQDDGSRGRDRVGSKGTAAAKAEALESKGSASGATPRRWRRSRSRSWARGSSPLDRARFGERHFGRPRRLGGLGGRLRAERPRRDRDRHADEPRADQVGEVVARVQGRGRRLAAAPARCRCARSRASPAPPGRWPRRPARSC